MTTTPGTVACPFPTRARRRASRPHNPSEGLAPPPAVPAGRVPRVTRLLALAIRLEQLVQARVIANYAALAELGHVSRARVSQIQNLLLLAPNIQEALLFLPRTERGRDPIHLGELEEASRVPAALFHACTPMLAISHGRQVALSTAFGKQGWYFDAWDNDPSWHKEKVTAEQCPRISRAFLEAQKQKMPERWFAQEYCNAFLDPLDSVFRQEDIDRLVNPSLQSELNWD